MLLKIVESVWKTKTFLSDMELQAAGWRQSMHDVKTATGPRVNLYVYDLATKWVWMCTLSRTEFVRISQAGHDTPEEVGPVRAGLSAVICDAAEARTPAPMVGASWEQQLGGLLAMYAGSTRTWELANKFADGGHFIVLNYRQAGQRHGLLRPLALRPDADAVLPVALLQSTVEQVLTLDRERHPEWFE
jgi:hypothetical protein